MLVVMLLRDGPRRFNDIKRNTGGISQQMLTRTLRALERDGMVTRTIFPTSPPQVEYRLTELGRSLSEPVLAFGRWVREHLAEVEAARERFDQRENTGNGPAEAGSPLRRRQLPTLAVIAAISACTSGSGSSRRRRGIAAPGTRPGIGPERGRAHQRRCVVEAGFRRRDQLGKRLRRIADRDQHVAHEAVAADALDRGAGEQRAEAGIVEPRPARRDAARSARRAAGSRARAVARANLFQGQTARQSSQP